VLVASVTAPQCAAVAEDFTWRDGERLIRFGQGAAAEVLPLLEVHGFVGYMLLTTERGADSAPGVVEAASGVIRVPAGRVDEISAELLEEAGDRPLVALGGGRVVDTAKAIAGARGGQPAAVPTTLSGAEMTPFHRTPAGVPGARMVRPALVVSDPGLMASQPTPRLAASAMNALAHAMEALYTPLANPVTDLAALRAAELIAAGLQSDPPDREEVSLGALLAGYASGATGIAVHHAVSQTIVRTAGTPHAETNAVMLPHSARLMAGRAPDAMGRFARALGDPEGDPDSAAARTATLAARSGATRLSSLGVKETQLEDLAARAGAHPLLANTPEPPDEEEFARLLRDAF
jgi:alcohol dehydrogenase class IV